MKQHLITLGIVIVGVLAASWVASKLGLNTYEEYSTFERAENGMKKAA